MNPLAKYRTCELREALAGHRTKHANRDELEPGLICLSCRGIRNELASRSRVRRRGPATNWRANSRQQK